jgi:hypothetical protein
VQVINRESDHPELIVHALQPQVMYARCFNCSNCAPTRGPQPVSLLPDPEDELRDLASQCEAEARAQLPAGDV